MGRPKVSRAMLTMSIARTTPAQNPRGLSRRIFFMVLRDLPQSASGCQCCRDEPVNVPVLRVALKRHYTKNRLSCKALLLKGFASFSERSEAELVSTSLCPPSSPSNVQIHCTTKTSSEARVPRPESESRSSLGTRYSRNPELFFTRNSVLGTRN